MIERILPASVAVAESFDDISDVSLFPEEEAVVRMVGGRRRREFTTVRACARRALAQLDLPPVPLLPGERGAPVWPAGVVGSMTHCLGYRAAVVARSSVLRAVGIDAEPHRPLPGGVLRSIAVPGERERHFRLCEEMPAICWDRVLFSAKESVYKAWFPLTGFWLGFHEADAVLGADGSFEVRVLRDGERCPRFFAGRWLVVRELIVTSVVDVI